MKTEMNSEMERETGQQAQQDANSPVAARKANCGYVDKVVPKVCRDCGAYSSTKEYPSWLRSDVAKSQFKAAGYAMKETHIRCTTHGFAVKRQGCCNDWRPSSNPQQT